MYNSYLEYVLDNPVNDNDFTKTAGFLDKLIGKGAKAVAEEAKVIPGREFISNPKNADKIRALREDIWRKQQKELDDNTRAYVRGMEKSIRKHSFPNGVADVKPTSVIKNQDGTRTLLYDNPYQFTAGNVPRNDPGFYKNMVYNDLLRKKMRTLAESHKRGYGLLHNASFGHLNNNGNAFGVHVGKPIDLRNIKPGDFRFGADATTPQKLIFQRNSSHEYV